MNHSGIILITFTLQIRAGSETFEIRLAHNHVSIDMKRTMFRGNDDHQYFLLEDGRLVDWPRVKFGRTNSMEDASKDEYSYLAKLKMYIPSVEGMALTQSVAASDSSSAPMQPYDSGLRTGSTGNAASQAEGIPFVPSRAIRQVPNNAAPSSNVCLTLFSKVGLMVGGWALIELAIALARSNINVASREGLAIIGFCGFFGAGLAMVCRDLSNNNELDLDFPNMGESPLTPNDFLSI